MSHDAHSAHGATDAAEVVEPQPIPLAPPRNYLWPLGLTLVVAALLIYFLLFYPNGGNLSDPPAPPGPSTGMTTVTVTAAVTATAEPSAVALSNPSPTPLLLITSPTDAATAVLPTASPPLIISPNVTIAATPAPIATIAVAAPRTLQLGNANFAVEAATQVSPTWQFNHDPSQASWLPTTALPYVIGIPYSADNAALFAAAKPGQVVTMQNSVGATLRFQVKTVARVQPNDTSGAAIKGPGLTLYLLADPAPDRAMISATLLDVSGGSAP